LWEDLILAGKQNLEASELLFLPCATCLAEPLQERLREWINRGGRAVAIAPPGILHAHAEDEVRLRVPVRRAVDLEIGLDLPMRRERNESVLPLALSPGEGVVIEIQE
jgi:hypothetical protein